MKESKLSIEEFGLKSINSKQSLDERGIFKKIYWAESQLNIEMPELKEVFFAFSKRGTFRGMHIHGPTHPMQKLLMVIDGVILDIIADCNESSKNYGTYIKRELDINSEAIFIPQGFAHGYQVLSEKATVMYLADVDFCPNCDSGFNWKSLGFELPVQKKIVSKKDSELINFVNYSYDKGDTHK